MRREQKIETVRDLSHTLTTGMPVYPGDPEVHLSDALTLDTDGVAVTHVRIGSHTGTHLDAPSHTVHGGRTLDEISLDELMGEALVIHVDAAERQALDSGALGLDQYEHVPRIVVIATGWDRYFGDPQYLAHPFLTGEAADRLWQLGMRMLATDTLSPDATPSHDFPVHGIVLGRDGLIVENLTGLTVLGDTAHLGFFPLKLGAVDGAPIRAVAFT
ncbi:MAG: cyclase family protein [Leucobacter sp.]